MDTKNRIETSIIIKSNVNNVWEILTNFDAYPSWNPFIKAIKGNLKLGAVLNNTLVNKDKEMVFHPVVTKLVEQKEFEWVGKALANTFVGRHNFTLEKISENETKLLQSEQFSGLLSSLLLLMIRNDTEKGFKEMNQALKNRAEEL